MPPFFALLRAAGDVADAAHVAAPAVEDVEDAAQDVEDVAHVAAPAVLRGRGRGGGRGRGRGRARGFTLSEVHKEY